MATPVITIFVRHSEGCKYEGDEFSRRCDCRKHFRWTANGKRYRQPAGTRLPNRVLPFYQYTRPGWESFPFSASTSAVIG